MLLILIYRLKQIVLWLPLLAYFPVMLGFISSRKNNLVCAGVVVHVADSLQTRFVSSKEIEMVVLDRFEGLPGQPFRDVDFEEIETFLKKHPAIKSCEVYSTLSGNLNIEVKQHQPLLRVFEANKSYYLDEEGRPMPLFDSFTARVLVAGGRVPTDTRSLVTLARFLHNDPFWRAQMEQVYIRTNGDYVLVPRVGDHLILLGPPVELARKMRNLKALYKKGLAPHEWNEYQTINLKYKGQILCSKNRNL